MFPGQNRPWSRCQILVGGSRRGTEGGYGGRLSPWRGSGGGSGGGRLVFPKGRGLVLHPGGTLAPYSTLRFAR